MTTVAPARPPRPPITIDRARLLERLDDYGMQPTNPAGLPWRFLPIVYTRSLGAFTDTVREGEMDFSPTTPIIIRALCASLRRPELVDDDDGFDATSSSVLLMGACDPLDYVEGIVRTSDDIQNTTDWTPLSHLTAYNHGLFEPLPFVRGNQAFRLSLRATAELESAAGVTVSLLAYKVV